MTDRPSHGPARILVTGATGIVGTELLDRLREMGGLDVTGVSARGGDGIAAWEMGVEPPGDAVEGHWDVIVHAAARTRFNQTHEEAERANVASTEALDLIASGDTHVVYLSTMALADRPTETGADDPSTFRNLYEWSKAEGERVAVAAFAPLTVVRFPNVIGRRSDGRIARFSGFYQLLGGLTSGLVPAVVGEGSARVDLVPVDDVASALVEIALEDRPARIRVHNIGCGGHAPELTALLDTIICALNSWRSSRGLPSLDRPPLIPPDRWKRLFLPLLREQLSPLRRRAIDLVSEFLPYLASAPSLEPDRPVDDPLPAVERSVEWWAQRNTRGASAIAEPWT